MTDHIFGKTLNRTLVAYENNDPVPVSSLISVAIYSSLSDAQSNVNPIVSLSGWTPNVAHPYDVKYTLPALSDPDPSYTRTAWMYWEGLSYQLETSGIVQKEFRSIEVQRATTGESVPNTGIADLKALFPALASYLSDPRLNDILALAYSQMKIDLEAKGINYDKARNLDAANLALAYLAISMSSEGLYSKTGQDVFLVRKDDYRKHYSDTLSKITLPNDADGDGMIDEIKDAQPSAWIISR
jgi:hypothetical protein